VISMDQARTLSGKNLLGAGGTKLGKIETLYADRDGGEPTFATVHTGLFGAKTHFVPLNEANMQGDDVQVPYDKDLVSSAPAIDPDAELEPAEEERLYSHYGVAGHGSTGQTGGYTETTTTTTGTTGTAGTTGRTEGFTEREDRTNEHGTVGHDTSGPTTDDAMTRSEERLQVGTQQTEVGRARLRKYIVSENVSQTVPVSREEVRVEREPITDANAGAAYDGPALSEEEHEVVLHAEKPVVAKETVPVERVRLDTQTVTEQQTVNEQVRKEVIDTDDVDVDRDGRTDRGTTNR
jgi:uncharacterized protein (TIGR02271 family)